MENNKNYLFRYVSMQYIHDCIEKNEQLDLESYRLNPGSFPARKTKGNGNRGNLQHLPFGTTLKR